MSITKILSLKLSKHTFLQEAVVGRDGAVVEVDGSQGGIVRTMYQGSESQVRATI